MMASWGNFFVAGRRASQAWARLPPGTRRKAYAWWSHPEARSPEGLFHMYGNVDELTESMAYTKVSRERSLPLAFSRFVFGAHWDALDTQRAPRHRL